MADIEISIPGATGLSQKQADELAIIFQNEVVSKLKSAATEGTNPTEIVVVAKAVLR